MTATASRAQRAGRLGLAIALVLAQGVMAQGPPAVTLETVASSATTYDFLAVSADGRHVAFLTDARLSALDTNVYFDIYVRDRVLGTTVLVSTTDEGLVSNGGSARPSISADGRFIAFSSSASNLVSGDTNNVDDIFVHDRDVEEDGVFDEPDRTSVTRVSVDTDGIEANCTSARPSISADGRFVAFDSCVTNWAAVGGKTFAVQDIFVHDRERAVTEWVNPPTQNSPNGFNNHHSGDASISADGRYVAFASQATTQPQPLNHFGSSQIYVRDTCLGAPGDCTPVTEWASPQVHVDFQPSAAFKPSISGDGRTVAFESASTSLVADDTNGATDVFVFDRANAVVTRVNVSSAGAQGVTVQPSTCSGSLHASISGTGRFVTFASCANNLVADDTVAPNFQDVFVHDRDRDGNGTFDEPGGISTVLISRNPAGITADSSSLQPAISSNGEVVVFSSFSRDITPTASPIGIYVWTTVNRPPTADAGADQTVPATGPDGATVLLDGSASSDPDGDPLTFTWTGPFGSLTGVSIEPTLGIGTHTVTLTVHDGRGATATDTVDITIASGETIDLALAVTAAPLSVETGDDVRYAIEVTNQDVVDASAVVVRTAIPAHVHYGGATLPGGACVGPAPGTAGVVACAVGALSAGATSSFTISLVPQAAGPLTLTFAIDGPHTDPTPGDTEVVVAVTVLPAPAVISIVEAIVVTDTATITAAALVSVTESIAVQDTPFVLPSALVGVTESIAVTDEVGIQPAAMLSVTEVVAVADTPATALPDTTPPVLTLPAPITATATSVAGAVVSYVASATDQVDGAIVPVCLPASGSMFPIALTTVTCAAVDSRGNLATGTFTVRVTVGVPWILGTASRTGRDAQGFFVDLTLTNGGNGHARDVQLRNQSFFTLAGSGGVTYDARISGPLPLLVGSLDVRESVTVRLYLRVPRTVRRFLAVETGTFETVTGVRLPLIAGQVIDPR